MHSIFYFFQRRCLFFFYLFFISGAFVHAQDVVESVLRNVAAGDRVRITVEEQPDLSDSYPVSGDGTVSLKGLGRVSVANLSLGNAAVAISRHLEEKYFKRATVNVEIDEFVDGQVVVYGGVKGSATIDVSDGKIVTLFEAIIQAGGLTTRAEGDKVKILRWKSGGGLQREIITVDVRAMMSDLDFRNDEWLRPRDLVFVPVTGGSGGDTSEVLLIGEVGAVGYHPYFEGLNVLRLVANTGGIPRTAKPDSARILRLTETGDYTVIPVDLTVILAEADMSQNYEMQPGDILYIPAVNYAKSGQAFVLGEVGKRGPVALPLNGEMGVARLMLSVGSTQFSNLSKVKLIRQAPDGSKITIRVDADSILKTGDFEDDIPLQDGDIIIVPTKIINI